MKIYLAHSSSYDYRGQLYDPLKRTLAKKYDIVFPHDDSDIGVKSKHIIAESDLILAEVSYPSTGQGIELGWAEVSGVPIVCFSRTGATPSGALRFICDTFLQYDTVDDMVKKLGEYLDARA